MTSALMQTYARSDLAFERGEGAYLFDGHDRKFLDFASGIAVNALGHCHPHMVEAVAKQAGKLWHCSNLYQIPEGERLAERLCAATFAESVFFSNSGSEAVECGLKLVRKYFDGAGAPERYRVIACEGAFHGRTLAAIAAGGQEKHLNGFDPAVEGFDHVSFGNLNEMRAAIGPETAAILVEPVQGEGGVNPAPPQYLQELRQTADEFGLLLFFDEVQCGMGRTGKLFAHEWSGVTPDVMASAKGLGGGFPMAACLATKKVGAVMTTGSHGSTYGGNPMAMAVGNAVLDVMEADGFLDGVNAVSKILRGRLEETVQARPGVLAGVRGLGLLLGLECQEGVANADLKARLQDNGLLTVGAAGNVVRLLPPLIIDESHVDEAIAIIEKSCAEMEESP
ncbi:MAG TPA: aspartate aminotransferase family protein [Rhodospirillales bacterium]|mgnify:CR=1 FL=1|nr:aspartate aminotransferase family protein [Rhodospirillales bacterium]